MKNKHVTKKIVAILSACAICAAIAGMAYYVKSKPEEVPYTVFSERVKEDKVELIEISMTSDTFVYTLRDGTEWITQNPKYDDFKRDMLEAGIDVKEKNLSGNLLSLSSTVLCGVFLLFMLKLMRQVTGKSSDIEKNFEKSSKSSVTFKDVAGLAEVKEDLKTIVDFLSNPSQYKSAGAKLPKGIIFYGPPGTGKTLLAKAVAGEADVNFIAVNGSDFEEKYVGVGANRVRKLFSLAKQKTPGIIFIDEIDAIGGKRFGTDPDKRQALNALLSEMDGFNAEEGVIVIAATNRLEDLDPALVRPGRFDNHFAVPIPLTSADRRQIIELYAKGKAFAHDIDFDILSKETLGFSPADIEVVLNEAAILAVRDGNGIITKRFVDDALYKQLMCGHAKKDIDRKEEEIKLAAWHEAGHALACVLLGREVTKVTIVPSTSGVGGATFHPREKLGVYSQAELEDELSILYAGRAAEALMGSVHNITTGASADIKQATEIIRAMITDYGMSSFGMLALDTLAIDENQVIEEAKRIFQKQYDAVLEILRCHQDSLERVAELLINKATITGTELVSVIHQHN